MTDQNYTDITLVLDNSSSMSSIADVTIENINEFISEQRQVDGKCLFSLVKFGSEVTPVLDAISMDEVENLTTENYSPYGMTALLDGVGYAVDSLGRRLSSMSEEERPSRVLVVIVTDGHENYSKEYTWADIKKRITHQQDVYSWEFVFLGANINVDEIQDQLNVNNAYTFSANNVGMRAAVQHLSASVRHARSHNASYAVSAPVAAASMFDDDSFDESFLKAIPVPTIRTKGSKSESSDVSE